MSKLLLFTLALGTGALAAVSSQAQVMQEGRSTYLHHHHHATHHYNMTYGNNPDRRVSYGVGSPNPRTTATGGNAGGYSNRN